jgi:hypothetical protein
MPARVLKAYRTQYPDPIQLARGDKVSLGKRDSDYPGWVWATSSVSGKSGWVPEQLLKTRGDEGEALRDYSAKELSVEEGDIVTVLEELLGWARIESSSGEVGWIPARHLARSLGQGDIPL